MYVTYKMVEDSMDERVLDKKIMMNRLVDRVADGYMGWTMRVVHRWKSQHTD